MGLQRVLLLIISLGVSGQSFGQSSQVNIAVAANFAEPVKEIAQNFHRQTGIKPVISIGSSGTLFAQISHGAPFDLFLSADALRPEKLVQQGKASDLHTYAKGRLALVTRGKSLASLNAFFTHPQFTKPVAIANPKLAPYGVAAMETLAHFFNDNEPWPFTLVQGKSVAQTYQYFQAGNVDVALVALSLTAKTQGDVFAIPSQYHSPIVQKLVLLKGADHTDEAKRFIDYLLSPQIQSTLQEWGYAPVTDE
ncbi:molybdate ABC transporter substrate-binding protein [Alteromonas sp. C1M14]|uniref:molybdate ABC transporter substrate-binding protein n=1 Tax=Alteromonas sp. C1M14 TaxID=2841567 RepID=UPI001C09679E|nr:molybdate ABC transporter substrate-binding protein [Alteromonas sp. C1M14]MBU2977138.1 molybdate ABC transporter substrate-binding protein [Alteromonas sp. C1M14]